MKRRDFLKTSSMAGGAVLSSWGAREALAQDASSREFYELRTYEMQTGNRRAVLNEYLEKAFIPALNRLGSRPVGVFSVVAGSNALNLFVLVPHASLESVLAGHGKLAADPEYLKAAAPYLLASIDDPAYTRYESTLLWAFKNLPKVRVPAETAGNTPRIFELRIYESHSEAAALKKVEMFNEGGEIAIFDKVGLRSVFFGQTLIGRRQPNLVYMTVHQDMAAREKAWENFRNSPGWKALSSNPVYANTVSATTVVFLRPAAYSQI
ncbi:MAG: NIPSNAP family protein [Vicinamibacterales bacterium]